MRHSNCLTPPSASESALLQRASRFDEAALAEIYDTYSPGVYRYAARLLGDPQLAEDCVADTFVRYLQALRVGGGPQTHLQAYLYRIAHNWITDFYRRQPLPALPLLDDLPSPEADLLHATLESIERQQVGAALFHLTPEQRQVIVLRYLEGWETELVADSLQKPVGSIKALQHRALSALRRLLLPAKEAIYDSTD